MASQAAKLHKYRVMEFNRHKKKLHHFVEGIGECRKCGIKRSDAEKKNLFICSKVGVISEVS